MRDGSRSTMLVAVLLAALACDPHSSGPGAKSPPEAPPPDFIQTCRLDNECQKVGTSCNGCCQEAAVNKAAVSFYEDHRQRTCAGYTGAICDCQPPNSQAACVNNRCTLVPATVP